MGNKPIKVMKGCRLGQFESIENAWSWYGASDEVAIFFGGEAIAANADPNNSNTPNITASYPASTTDIHATNEESEPRLLQNGTSTSPEASPGSQAVIANSSNGITPNQIAKCAVLAASESVLSQKLGLAKEPEKDGMHTPLLSGAEDKLCPAKPHRLGPKERETVDQVLDEQRRQGRLVDAEGSQASWPVFFVKQCSEWKAVVDLRTWNQSIVSETYLSPSRTDGRSWCVNQTVDVLIQRSWQAA
jgi:hypothetical protein